MGFVLAVCANVSGTPAELGTQKAWALHEPPPSQPGPKEQYITRKYTRPPSSLGGRLPSLPTEYYRFVRIFRLPRRTRRLWGGVGNRGGRVHEAESRERGEEDRIPPRSCCRNSIASGSRQPV